MILPHPYEELGDRPYPMSPNAKCPKCKKKLVYLGRYFKIPPQNAFDQWRKVELLWRSGWTANGCSSGPRTVRDAREFAQQIPDAKDRAHLQKQAEAEERWRQLQLKRFYLKRHKNV